MTDPMELKAIKINTLVTILSIVAFLGGGGVFLWKSSASLTEMAKQVQVNTGRIDKLENTGSPALMAHIQSDSIDSNVIHERVAKLEKALELMSQLQITMASVNGRLDTLDAKIDAVRKALDEHNRSTARALGKDMP